MKKQEVLDQIRGARAAMLAAIDNLSDDVMLRPFAVGIWSVKDTLAHLSIWQSELVTALSRLDKPRVAPSIVEIEDINGWNEEQYRVNARRSLEVIVDDYHGVHKHLLKAVESLDEKTLNDARRFPWMEGEPIWYLIAENGYLHEQEHAEDIRRWRQEQGL